MELIDLINDLEKFRNKGFRDCNVEKIILKLKRIENDKKVKIPKFVADWIKYCKNTFLSLARALTVNEVDFYNYANQEDHSRLMIFLESEINQRIFARAWLDGYEVEQERLYSVEVKGVSGYGRYLNKVLSSGEYFFASDTELGLYKTKHTKEELENSGFGWVFDCPGVEVKEVK